MPLSYIKNRTIKQYYKEETFNYQGSSSCTSEKLSSSDDDKLSWLFKTERKLESGLIKKRKENKVIQIPNMT